MNKILATLLLCPLAAVAADWRYDGQAMSGGSSSSGETAMAAAETSSAGMNVSAGPAPADAPRGAMTMEQVRASKGDPDSILGAVGDPPITRWQYPEYVVYFEHDLVITSVAGHW